MTRTLPLQACGGLVRRFPESTIRASRVNSFRSTSGSQRMSRYSVTGSTANVAVFATLLVVGATATARAASPDCTKIDATAAATVLGVPKTRSNSIGRHHKQQPDNMDVLGCAYAEVSPDPMARTLTYFIYTPI